MKETDVGERVIQELMRLTGRDLVGRTVVFAESLGYLVGLDDLGHFLCFGRLLVEALPEALEQPSPPQAKRSGKRRGWEQRKNPERLAEATALREQGLAWGEIGARLGVAGNTARRWALSDSPPTADKPRRRGHTAAQMAAREAHVIQAKHLRAQGLSYREIAGEMGTNVSTAHRWANGG